MGRPPKKTLGQQVAKARQNVLADILRAHISARGLADPASRKEVKEMRSDALPIVEAIRISMLTGDLDLDKEWCDVADKFMDRAEGKAAQNLVHSGGVKTEVEFVIGKGYADGH
jgi:hypothetical protein